MRIYFLMKKINNLKWYNIQLIKHEQHPHQNDLREENHGPQCRLNNANKAFRVYHKKLANPSTSNWMLTLIKPQAASATGLSYKTEIGWNSSNIFNSRSLIR